jgi:hypothetical protein
MDRGTGEGMQQKSIVIKAKEVAKLYNIIRKCQAHEIDYEVQPKDWLHPADTESLNNKMSTLYKFSQTAARGARGCSWNNNIYPE